MDDLSDDQKENLKEYLKSKILAPTLHGVHSVLDLGDRYGGAPIRAGLNHMQNVADKYKDAPINEQLGDKAANEFYGGAFQAAKDQFGKEDRSKVPSGKQIMERMGVSGAGLSDLVPGGNSLFEAQDAKYKGGGASERLLGISSPSEGEPSLSRKGGPLDVSPSGAAGMALDTQIDPTVHIPFGKIKNLMGGAKKAEAVGSKVLHDFVEPEVFSEAVNKARAHSPLHAQNITAYSPEEYSGMRTYLSPDKKSGYAIKPDGELVSVFSTAKGRGDDIVKHAVENGAMHLDAFDINKKLPELYGKHGFLEYKREPNWTPNGPDVVYMSQPWNKNLSMDDIVRLQEAQLPKELQRTFPPMDSVKANPEDIAAVDKAAKQMQFERVKELLDRRNKLKSKNLDEITEKIK